MDKKVASILRKIQDVPGLSEDEKFLHAKCLAATPDERWRMNRTFLRSLGLLKRSEQTRRGLC
jgi:hypothetical protein